MNIIPVTYISTNYFILHSGNTKLLIDAGWPGTFGEFNHALQKKDINISDINYLLVTHYHPDHAGLVQNLKDEGVKLIIVEGQLPFVAQLTDLIKPGVAFKPIGLADNIIITISSSRAFLKTVGFDGEIIHTPGHSDDSISLVLDTGEAFIGDLPPNHFTNDGDDLVSKSWQKLRVCGAKKIYHAHVNPFFI